jgi:hypothetical protein
VVGVDRVAQPEHPGRSAVPSNAGWPWQIASAQIQTATLQPINTANKPMVEIHLWETGIRDEVAEATEDSPA